MTLPGIPEIFKQADPPERVQRPVPAPPGDTHREVLVERRADGAIRVLHRDGPGCATHCVAVLTRGEEYDKYAAMLKEA